MNFCRIFDKGNRFQKNISKYFLKFSDFSLKYFLRIGSIEILRSWKYGDFREKKKKKKKNILKISKDIWSYGAGLRDDLSSIFFSLWIDAECIDTRCEIIYFFFQNL